MIEESRWREIKKKRKERTGKKRANMKGRREERGEEMSLGERRINEREELVVEESFILENSQSDTQLGGKQSLSRMIRQRQ